ncbi:CARDB domain-containing protein [Aquimarina sp. MMG016]|uniref:CARDB domain-containing protein n=1 Tax=Aquimarina sp. MMG016 TaxID=2822690 RepID=UPI001B3A3582|nr:CARDB domain-containing protein [Aquimarina sp. MMG016]MBQ4819336.1 hypothetical protein [Aquimarina sp. MMG016]
MKSKLALILLLVYSTINYAQTSFSSNEKSYGYSLDCENNQLDIFIELKDNNSSLTLPNFKTLITQEGEYGSIDLNICIKDLRAVPIPEEYQLDINFQGLQTTLEPVKIPPPPPPLSNQQIAPLDNKTQKRSQSIGCDHFLRISLPEYAYGENRPFDAGLYSGDYEMDLLLLKDNITVVSEQEKIPFTVYSMETHKDFKSNIDGVSINALNDKVLVEGYFYNELGDRISDKFDYRMHLYVSNDDNFDTNDLLRGNIVSNRDDGFWFELTKYQYDWYLNNNMYLISVIDPLNDYEEICENNNWHAYKVTKPYELLSEIKPNFSILDARIYKDQPEKVTLSCTVANSRFTGITGPSELKVGVYYKSNEGEEVLINTLDAGNLQPFEKRVISLQMNENYYGAWYSGKELIFKVDPENQYPEANEQNKIDNIKKIINTNVSFDARNKVSIQQDFSNRAINFSFYASIPNQKIIINIYNAEGEYVKSIGFSLENDEPGTFEFTKHVLQVGLEDGLYYYSAHFGEYDPLSGNSWEYSYQQIYNQYNGSFYKGEAPDLQIDDVRFEKTPDNNWVYIEATVTNKGNIASTHTKLDFYRENYPREFIKAEYVPALDPGQQAKVTLRVSWQYYSIALRMKKMILILDPDDRVEEMYETNNEKNVNIPNFFQEDTYVTVSPNPFSNNDQLNFDFKTHFRNTDIKLNIYNQQGILQYHTQNFYPRPGDQKITISPSQFRNSGIYHYSFLIGWNNNYYPFTGTIIKH